MLQAKEIARFKVAGVPEHFNFPWHYAQDQGYFSANRLEVSWQDIKSGTGTLTRMLNDNETDLAVLLTEGILADIAKGGKSKIVQVFVKSPLNWGIHVSSASRIRHKFAIKGKRFAISRFGSGSHIMAYVLCKQLGYIPQASDFVVVNDLEGAREALVNKEAEVFLWEKYMTMPLVDAGYFNRIGEIPTPWPGFVIAANENTCREREKELRRLLEVMRTACGDFMMHPDAFELIAGKYSLKKDKMFEWFQITEWETSEQIHGDMLYATLQTLENVGIISTYENPEKYCAQWSQII